MQRWFFEIPSSLSPLPSASFPPLFSTAEQSYQLTLICTLNVLYTLSGKEIITTPCSEKAVSAHKYRLSCVPIYVKVRDKVRKVSLNSLPPVPSH